MKSYLSKANFHSLINIIISKDALNVDAKGLAKIVRLSVPTCQRWIDGKSAPHKYMRVGIIDKLFKMAHAKYVIKRG